MLLYGETWLSTTFFGMWYSSPVYMQQRSRAGQRAEAKAKQEAAAAAVKAEQEAEALKVIEATSRRCSGED